MIIPRRTLTSLPSDVLHEILKLLLFDTPRSPQRAAVLGTCSLLHDLGLPLLYRIVDLTGMENRSTVIIHWKRLFGDGGLFVKGIKTARGFEVGSFVRELRLGGGDTYEGGHWKDFPIRPLLLPLCSTLFFDCTQLHNSNCPLLKLLLPSIPVDDLVLSYRTTVHWGDRLPLAGFSLPIAEHLGIDPQPWENLERIIFHGCPWRDDFVKGSPKVSCSSLSFRSLVVEVPATKAQDLDRALKLFLEPNLKEGERFLENVERIEFRMDGQIAKGTEEKFREEVRKRVARGLSSLEKRLLPLFVFVSEDGTEGSFEGVE